MKSELSASGIEFSTSTLPVLANWLYSNFWQFFFFHNPYHHLKLFLFLKSYHIDYIYCRSYHAGFAACRIRSLFRLKTAVHFDPRSLFVEEGRFLGRIGGLSLWWWKKVEKYVYEKADIVSFVSRPFQELQIGKHKVQKSLLAYTHVDVNAFKEAKGTTTPPIRFCYLGQLDSAGWHHTTHLLQLFKQLRSQLDSSLLILTHSDPAPIQSLAANMGLTAHVKISQTKSVSETAVALADCHFGLLSYKPLKTVLEKDLAYTVVSSKAAEYLAAGLPLICNRELRGIAELVEKQKLGITYELGAEIAVPEQVKALLAEYQSLSSRCQQAARECFDVKKNVRLMEKEVDALCAP